MVIYSIYKATNQVNGKSYIGFTSNFTHRKYRHKHYALSKKIDSYFYNAIRKYGWNSFIWEILYQSFDVDHCLNVMESHFIREYKTFVGFSDCLGYNTTMGGDGTLGFKEPKSEKHKNNISKALTGRKLSNEHIISAAMGRSKEYKMLNPKNEIIIIKNMSEYCRENKLNQSHMISVSLGRYGFKSHKGYKKI
jgi:group I intron endonuclease